METIQVAPNGMSDGGVPSGCILMWSGSTATIPNGWHLCDGSNGTPDLRNRFIVGAGSSYSPGNTGGASTVALTTDQIPKHSHTITGGSHSHAISGGAHSHSFGSSLKVDVKGGKYFPNRLSRYDLWDSQKWPQFHTTGRSINNRIY